MCVVGKVDLEELKEEWEDYQMVQDAEFKDDLRLDQAWGILLDMKTSLGRMRFPQLKLVISTLLSLPHSNAASERAFSMVRKIHTDNRKSMLPKTLTGFLQVKINCDDPCHSVSIPKELLQSAKSATKKYNDTHKKRPREDSDSDSD